MNKREITYGPNGLESRVLGVVVGVSIVAMPVRGCSRATDGKHVWTWHLTKGWLCVGCDKSMPRFMGNAGGL